MRCEYNLSSKEDHYPRVTYDCECGFEYVKMEGYQFDIDGGRTNNLCPPTGKCMKCNGDIVFNPPSEEKEGSQ